MSAIKYLFLMPFLLLFVNELPALAAPLGNCALEGPLASRSDIVFCEPWESSTWWQAAGYDKGGDKDSVHPVVAGDVSRTSIVSTNCKSGNCLQITWPGGGDNSGMGVHWRLSSAGLQPQELYVRYYIKIDSSWPQNDSNVNAGKMLGVADVRSTSDSVGVPTGSVYFPAGGQCGNGGESSDGLWCWSARGIWRSGGSEELNSIKSGAKTRMGYYLYYQGQLALSNGTGIPGFFDSSSQNQPWGANTGKECSVGQAYNNFWCGLGNAGALLPNQWYAVEMYVKMNTAGTDDGILRAWVDGVLSYQKTNMRFRLTGHNNLHVRTVWLDFYAGGPTGFTSPVTIWVDQMVIATNAPIGLLASGTDTTPPAAPTNLHIQ